MGQKSVYKLELRIYFHVMVIVTRKGDKGTSQLFSGEIVSKNDIRLNTYGTMDELVSFMGLARSFCKRNEVTEKLYQEQKRLFKLGTELATKDFSKIGSNPVSKKDVDEIEALIDEFLSKITLPTSFIIPGKNNASALLDVSRTVCRRFERHLVALKERGEWSNPNALVYVNRLSDLLYIMARMEE